MAYNPENDNWAVGTPMPTARYNLAVVSVNDLIYAIGGSYTGSVTTIYNVNEEYTPPGYGTTPSISPSSSTEASPIPTMSPSPTIPELTPAAVLIVAAITCIVAIKAKKGRL